MKRYSWKYMAGLIDGEGCIDMQGSTDKRTGVYYCRPRLRMTLSGEVGEFLIPQFVANFGGHLDVKRRFEQNPNWQTAHTWLLTGKTPLRKFLQNIFKHLVIKREQAIFAIWWIDNMMGKQVAAEARRLGVEELKAMKRSPHRLSDSAIQAISELMRQSD